MSTNRFTHDELTFRDGRLSRRSGLQWTAGTILITLAIVMSLAGWDVAAAQASAKPVTGEFVGLVAPANGASPTAGAGRELLAVALIADAPQGTAAARRVRAYVCDGRFIAEWMVGQVQGNRVDLTSVAGMHNLDATGRSPATPTAGGKVRLVADLSEAAATGTVTLDDGETRIFRAPRSDGKTGLYTLQITADGTISGSSGSGTRLAGRVTAQQLESTLTLPNGTTVPFVDPRGGSPTAGTWSVIVAPVDDPSDADGLDAVGALQAKSGDPKAGFSGYWLLI